MLHRKVVVVAKLLVGEGPDIGRFQKGDGMEGNCPVSVLQKHRFNPACIDGGEVYASGVHDPDAEGDALCRIVVAAYHYDFLPGLLKPCKKIVEQANRLLGGHGAVKNIPGDEADIGLFALRCLHNLCEHGFLVLKQGTLIDAYSQM